MASKRRLGLENSTSRTALMDGVEAVLREDGYAALSARSVAERAGLKHQLVYYYFQTMDDLLMATYRRHTDRVYERIETASQSPRPLHAIWDAYSNPLDARLNMEFLVMANHNEAIRAETIAIGEESRQVGLDKIEQLLNRTALDNNVFGPLAVTMAISAIGGIVGLESALGISGGHAEMRAMVEWCLNQLEPEPAVVESS
jgi:AcrR family transcriptional regulator